jgi:hypothetical protein
MKGICFKEPLFHATVEGKKTQTRRIVVKRINKSLVLPENMYLNPFGEWCGTFLGKQLIVKPRYKVGEKVYLKEPYSQDYTVNSNEVGLLYEATGKILYRYAGDKLNGFADSKIFGRWQSKLFMPDKYARYFIEITAVRCERLQEIAWEDCVKEGIFQHISHNKVYWKNGVDGLMYNTPREAYAALIDKINSKGTWESNPWGWVYDYKLVK